MNAPLPDVSLTDRVTNGCPLDWVGMQGIDIPVTLKESGYQRDLHARADLAVDLQQPEVKGIHMSRLYRLLDAWSEREALTPASLQQLLQTMIDSHLDCASQNARVVLQFDLLTRRPALITPDLSGWTAYPVQMTAMLRQGVFSLEMQVTACYSSTCPCSAALARQLVEQGFRQAFAGQQHLDATVVADWLRQHATLATPHSQRSEAEVRVQLGAESGSLGLFELIDRVEQALGTPVQTAVKRADEQAFAAMNGQNLMFVEDAARRIQAALDGHYHQPRVQVRHLESLHPHDAVASAGVRRAPRPVEPV
ncbi:GTP cyclohydrolase FolE2 [Halopseudomonas salegens]|uniref:GTP cyclohydrolase FolE2 n=1 Tax=Halopseudomonas salegens TaxID=1434072 RepID=A0A1H2HTN8_9GAMM|nr:GTP cyclohydrolase FolE2 [Halopseudomonas salegens]SDU35076.1 GTP cyclohydrolase I [Halopseudomonas salegens]